MPDRRDPDGRREVRVRVNFMRMFNIDVQAQTFKAELYLEASWVDKQMQRARLEHAGVRHETYGSVDEANSNQGKGHLKLRELPEMTFFTPRVRFRNVVETHEFEEWFAIYPPREAHGGDTCVCFRTRVIATFQEEFELARFPLDHQRLTVNLISEHPAKEVQLLRNLNSQYRSIVNLDAFPMKAQYSLKDTLEFKQANTKPEWSASGVEYPMLFISMTVTRRWGYWWWNIMMPLALIGLVSLSSFALDWDELADRSAVTLTMLLTIVAFKIIVSEKLPDVDYLTLIDKYMLSSLTIVAVILMCNVVVKNGYACMSIFWHQEEITRAEKAAPRAVIYIGHVSSSDAEKAKTQVKEALGPARVKAVQYFDMRAEEERRRLTRHGLNPPTRNFILVRMINEGCAKEAIEVPTGGDLPSSRGSAGWMEALAEHIGSPPGPGPGKGGRLDIALAVPEYSRLLDE